MQIHIQKLRVIEMLKSKSNHISQMTNKASFRVIPYFISQYLFFFIILLIFAFANQSTSTHIAEERFCSASTGNSFSNQYDPDYFYHLTDVHVTHYSKQTQDIFEKSLEIGAAYKSKSVLITGDLVDNYYLPYVYNDAQETKQMQEDWEEYHRVASKFTNKYDKIIESFGNHDIPRILSPDSHNFFYNKYSMIAQSHNNFSQLNDTYDVFTEKVGNFTFVVLNPIFFPIPPLPFTYYVHAPTQYIEKVDKIINSIPENESIIIATHFQGPVWSDWYCPFVRSYSTAHFFNEILQKVNVKMLLTGHNHGAGRMVMHHKNSFEVCASDLRENSRSGLVTNDNGNVVYHWFSIDKPTRSFVTFPAPIDQTTSRTDCAVSKVRVISFEKVKSDKYVEIDGKRLKLKRIRKLNQNDDAWLYEVNVSFLTKGRHNLKLEGEDEEEFEFIYGQSAKIESTPELLYDDMLWAHNQWIGLNVLVIVFIVATFPFKIFTFEKYWRWINKLDKSDTLTDVKYYMLSIFGTFAGIRSRFIRLPSLLRYSLFVSVILSIFLPIFTFDVSGVYGYMFIFGYHLCHGQISGQIFTDKSLGDHFISRLYDRLGLRYEVWCPFLGFYYFAVAVVPVVLSASSLGLKPNGEKESRLQIVDFVVQIGSIIGGVVICFDAFLLLCERKCALMSPFILFPMTWLAIFVSFFVWRRNEMIKKFGAKKSDNDTTFYNQMKNENDDANFSKAHKFCTY